MTRLHAWAFVLLSLCASPILTQPAAGASSAPSAAPLTMDCWLTDGRFELMSKVYGDEFQVGANRHLRVHRTKPGEFYMNLLLHAPTDITDLEITVLMGVPEDFAYKGRTSVHVWVDNFDVTAPDPRTAIFAGGPEDPLAGSFKFGPLSVAAGSQVYMTVRVEYSLDFLPSDTYLPRVYTFGAFASGSGGSALAFASMTGVLKR